VVVVDEVLPHALAYGFLQRCDCFVSLHIARKALGVCLAEAMLLGQAGDRDQLLRQSAFMNHG